MRELARTVGISSGYLNELEKGTRWGSPDMHDRLAEALGVDVDVITYDARTHTECPRCHGRGVVPIEHGTPAGAAA